MSTAVDNQCNQIPTLSPLERMAAQARLEIYPDRCLKLRHRKSSCQTCQDFCPAEAISFGDSLEIDYSRCHGCGICANLCPTEVFQLGRYSYNKLLAQVEGNDTVEFACSRWAGKANAVVPCLGYLNESLLISTIARGAQAVRLITAPCQSCQFRLGFQAALRSLRRANEILALFGLPDKVQLAAGGHSDSHNEQDSRHYSRRELFTYLSRGMWNRVIPTGESAEIAAKGLNRARTCLEPRLPEKRRLLLQSLKALGEPVIATLECKVSPFLQIEKAVGCDGCGLCVTFCPSGALRQYDHDGKRAIEFSSAFCLACNLCFEICPTGALTSSTHLSTDDLLVGKSRVLVERRYVTCVRCGRTNIMSSGADLCSNCQKEKEIKEWLVRSN